MARLQEVSVNASPQTLKAFRKSYFEGLRNHAYYGKDFDRLRKDGIEFINQFIEANGEDDPNQWMMKARRIFLGEKAPRFASLACDFLTAIGSGSRDVALKK